MDAARLDAPTLIAAAGVVPKPCGARELIGAVGLALERPLRRSSHPTLDGLERVDIDDPQTEEP